MERQDIGGSDRLPVNQVQKALSHFRAGLVGKGEHEDIAWRQSAVDQVCHAVHGTGGFPRACAGQYQCMPLPVGHDLLLVFVEHEKTEGC